MSTTVRVSIEQYDQMIADGAFEREMSRDRVELIDGEVRQMSPIGPLHEDVVVFLTEWSYEALPQQSAKVRIQSTVGLPALSSVPQPDVAWVRWARYSRRRPTADEVLLIIEVADSSLRYDRGEKAEMYASAGIADYWVVDIPNQAVHVYRNPEAGRFASCESVRGAARVSPLRIPTAVLVVESIFVASEPEADVGEHPTDDRAI